MHSLTQSLILDQCMDGGGGQSSTRTTLRGVWCLHNHDQYTQRGDHRRWLHEDGHSVTSMHSSQLGNRWSEIARDSRLKGRTDKSVRDRYESLQRKQTGKAQVCCNSSTIYFVVSYTLRVCSDGLVVTRGFTHNRPLLTTTDHYSNFNIVHKYSCTTCVTHMYAA